MKQTTYTLVLFIFLTTSSFKSLGQNQQAMRHEFVKRGNHVNEMATGNYAILAVAASEINAKQMAEEIQKSGYPNVDFGYLSAKKSWYIYVSSANDDIEKAKAIRDDYRKVERFKEAWILTVHE